MLPNALQEALAMSAGARIFRCALQVNPYTYLQTRNKPLPAGCDDEDSYNRAVVDALLGAAVEVVAVTDHHRVTSARHLLSAASAAGITALPGFEACTKDNVHILVIFDPDRDLDEIDRCLGQLGVRTREDEGGCATLDTLELLEEAEDWGAVAIAAHALWGNGILKELSGQARINAWTSDHLHAAAIPGPVDHLDEGMARIVRGEAVEYTRRYPVALVNARDISGPDDVMKPGAWTDIKMTVPSVDGLRQAFYDPESRIRLSTYAPRAAHAVVEAVAWEGGFLDGVRLRLNDGFNVLIGGRGSGKSTVVESIRYLFDLDPPTEDMRGTHRGFVQKVLEPGTRVAALVTVPDPSASRYLIERTVPNPPTVRTVDGQPLAVGPDEIISHLQVFGQREIAEYARQPGQRARLLERFITRDPGVVTRTDSVRRSLERNRRRLDELVDEFNDAEARLERLPLLREQQRRYEEAGVEARLLLQRRLQSDMGVLRTARSRVDPFEQMIAELADDLPIDRSLVSPQARAGSESADLLEDADQALAELDAALRSSRDSIADAVSAASQRLDHAMESLSERIARAREDYENALRAAGSTDAEGERFLTIGQQIERLRPVQERHRRLRAEQEALLAERTALLVEWHDLQQEDFQLLRKAAKRVSERLYPTVRVAVRFGGDRRPLVDFLTEQVGGRLDRVRSRLRDAATLSIADFVAACRAGPDDLSHRYGITGDQAQRLSQMSAPTLMELEELVLPTTTDVYLNVRPQGTAPSW